MKKRTRLIVAIMFVVAGLGCWAGIALYRFCMRAQTIRMASAGVSLYLVIFDADHEAAAVSNAPAYPVAGQYRSSTDFIRTVMTKAGFEDDSIFWFLNPIMQPAHADSQDGNAWHPAYNAWCVAVLPDEKTARKQIGIANAPFLFTRNIAFGDPPGPFRPGMTTADMNGLLPDQHPFGKRACVVITYGGMRRVIPGSQATQQVLNPGRHALEILLP